jgi:hypothetical protein
MDELIPITLLFESSELPLFNAASIWILSSRKPLIVPLVISGCWELSGYPNAYTVSLSFSVSESPNFINYWRFFPLSLINAMSNSGWTNKISPLKTDFPVSGKFMIKLLLFSITWTAAVTIWY